MSVQKLFRGLYPWTPVSEGRGGKAKERVRLEGMGGKECEGRKDEGKGREGGREKEGRI
jgi:hypothetical protein